VIPQGTNALAKTLEGESGEIRLTNRVVDLLTPGHQSY
jgi:hypothetical protein